MPQWKGPYPGVQIGVDGLKEDRKLGGIDLGRVEVELIKIKLTQFSKN